MEMEIIKTSKVYEAIGPYSMGIVHGDLIFTAGLGGLKPDTGKVPSNDVEEQTVQCLENVKAVLEAAGAGFKDVIKVVVYLINMKDFAKVNAIYAKYVGAHLPVRSCVGVKELPADELVKMEVIARKP